MKLIHKILGLAALSLGLLAAPALGSAQRGPGPEHEGRGPHGLRGLLRQLDLTDNQRTQIRAIMEDARTRHQALRGQRGTPAARTERRAIHEETRRLIHDVLTPAQRERARTLMQQHRAEHIDRRLGRLTQRLALTDAQQRQIRTILERAHPAQEGPPAPEQRRARFQQVKSEIDAVLTPAQREQMRALHEQHRGRRGHRGHDCDDDSDSDQAVGNDA